MVLVHSITILRYILSCRKEKSVQCGLIPDLNPLLTYKPIFYFLIYLITFNPNKRKKNFIIYLYFFILKILYLILNNHHKKHLNMLGINENIPNRVIHCILCTQQIGIPFLCNVCSFSPLHQFVLLS